MADATAEDLITLVYTSGTTGPPKGVMINNTNFSYAVKQVLYVDGRVSGKPLNPDDLIVTYLPLCHIAERIFSTWSSVASGCSLNFAESIETVQQNLREIQPTIFFDPRHHRNQGSRRHLVQEAVVWLWDETVCDYWKTAGGK